MITKIIVWPYSQTPTDWRIMLCFGGSCWPFHTRFCTTTSPASKSMQDQRRLMISELTFEEM